MKPQSCAASAVGPSLPPGSAWFLAPAPGSCQLRFPAGRRQRPGQAEPSACSAPGACPSPSAERPVSTRFYPDCRLPDCSLETRYGQMAQVQTQISLGNTLPPWGVIFCVCHDTERNIRFTGPGRKETWIFSFGPKFITRQPRPRPFRVPASFCRSLQESEVFPDQILQTA